MTSSKVSPETGISTSTLRKLTKRITKNIKELFFFFKKEENVCIVQAYPESNVMGDEESDLILRSPWLPRTGEICKLVSDSVDSWKEEERNQWFRVCLVISLFIFKL